MNIQNIILQSVLKTENKQDAKIGVKRKLENTVNDESKKLCSDLTILFSKTGLSQGGFTKKHDDDPDPHFETYLNKYYKDEDNSFDSFPAFSTAVCNHLVECLNKATATAAKGVYVWFNHYIEADKHFLIVALLMDKDGLAVDDNAELVKIESLDLERLHMAARINLTTWKNGGNERYIAFKAGKRTPDVRNYFLEFVGCSNYTLSKVDTNNLKLVADEWCRKHEFNSDKSSQVRSDIFDYCTKCLNEDIEVKLDSLSIILDEKYNIDDDNKGLFLSVSQNEPYNMDNVVSVNKTELRKFKRYSGRNKDISISFDNSLLEKDIIFDSNKETLIILSIPDNLLKELKQDYGNPE